MRTIYIVGLTTEEEQKAEQLGYVSIGHGTLTKAVALSVTSQLPEHMAAIGKIVVPEEEKGA